MTALGSPGCRAPCGSRARGSSTPNVPAARMMACALFSARPRARCAARIGRRGTHEVLLSRTCLPRTSRRGDQHRGSLTVRAVRSRCRTTRAARSGAGGRARVPSVTGAARGGRLGAWWTCTDAGARGPSSMTRSSTACAARAAATGSGVFQPVRQSLRSEASGRISEAFDDRVLVARASMKATRRFWSRRTAPSTSHAISGAAAGALPGSGVAAAFASCLRDMAEVNGLGDRTEDMTQAP